MENEMDSDERLDSDESELSLSCGSSPFEDGEGNESENEATESGNAIGNRAILPYQFEPYLSEPENSQDGHDNEDNENENRLDDNSWCHCGHSQVMPTARECVCCDEVDRVTTVKDEYPNTQCITDHPGFDPVCLNIHVLEVAYYQYRQQYGERQEQNNERHRYTAYRQFVRWCWHYLGKDVRVVIPSCAVLKIRSAFPDQTQNYTGFHGPDSD